MAYNSDRTIDQKAEHEVHVYLNKYFYPAFQSTMEPAGRQEQLDGIDMHVCINNKWVTIDEKAQLTRLNQAITDKTTQALEVLSKMKNGIYRQGWIYNDNKTDYYLFMYITGCNTKFKNELTCDKITRIRAVLISKARVFEMIHNEGYTLKNIMFFAKQMLKGFFHRMSESIEYGKRYVRKYIEFKNTSENLWLCYTEEGLKEQPINCVIRWSLYEKYAWKVYDITPDGVIDLKNGGNVVWPIQKI